MCYIKKMTAYGLITAGRTVNNERVILMKYYVNKRHLPEVLETESDLSYP